MVDEKILVDELFKLIYVAEVKAFGKIYVYISDAEYQKATAAKESFFTIGTLPVYFGQIQQATANINCYAPNLKSGLRDRAKLSNMLLAVKPLIEDAYTPLISTEFTTAQVISEPSIPYHFNNIRVKIFSVDVDKKQNIKL